MVIERAFDPDPSLRWLFWMAHPDDEVAIAAWIRRRTQAGNSVALAWTHSTPVRQAESRAVAARLGVPDDHLWFFTAPDGHALDHLATLQPHFQAVSATFRPDRVAVPAFEQGHLDHDATNLLANLTWPGHVLEFPMYHTYLGRYQTLNAFAGEGPGERLDLQREESALKITCARAYPSQTLWRNVLWYERIWRWLGRAPRLAHREWLRVQTHRDFRTPNHPSPLRSRIQRSHEWARWLTALDQFETPALPRDLQN